MKKLSMTSKARNARRFCPWWCSESPARGYGGQLLNIASRFHREGVGCAQWQSDLMVLHVAWQQYVTFSICADTRCPPMRIKYVVPTVSQDIGFTRDGLLDWIDEFREMIAGVKDELPPVEGVEERVLDYWKLMRAIAEVAGGRWPGAVERLMRRMTDVTANPIVFEGEG